MTTHDDKRRWPVETWSLIALLSVRAFAVLLGSAVGLLFYRDRTYPDSATHLFVAEFVRSGHIYQDFNQPPYWGTLYPPLMYVLFRIPYSLAERFGSDPLVWERTAALLTLGLCFVLTYGVGRRLSGSVLSGSICVLFAAAVPSLGEWAGQLRGDFFGVALSLASVWLVLFSEDSRWRIGSAICAGLALLAKPTFVSLPAAVVLWLLLNGRARAAAQWAFIFLLTTGTTYGFALWHEPMMLRNLSTAWYVPSEYVQAARITWRAVSQPAVMLAIVGAMVAWKQSFSGRQLVVLYWAISWLVGIATIRHVGGNINYFWEGAFTSAILAGDVLRTLQSRVERWPPALRGALLAVIVLCCRPVQSASYLTSFRGQLETLPEKRAHWNGFVAALKGRRLLSTTAEITAISAVPEMPDPYWNSCLEIRGAWDPEPLAAQIRAGAYDAIVVRESEADGVGGYRGVPMLGEPIRRALKSAYRPHCKIEFFELWLPNRSPDATLSKLAENGCR